MDLNQQFEKAAKDALNLSQRPGNDTLLKLYALYKQGSEGDIEGKKPGMLDIKGRKKFEAWEKLKGLSPEDAKSKYVDLVDELS